MTTTGPATRFTDDREQYQKDGEEQLIYAAGLYLPAKVRPLCETLRQLAADAEAISIASPLSLRTLRALRARHAQLAREYAVALENCLKRLAEPVEGAATLDLGWVQGFTVANALAAITELNTVYSSASETLDRKTAYVIACMSMYVAVVSLTATVTLGLMAL